MVPTPGVPSNVDEATAMITAAVNDENAPPLPDPKLNPLDMPTTAETDEWLSKVDDITAQVNKIISGEMDSGEFEALDKKMALKQRAAEISKMEKLEKQQRALNLGRDGKGEGTDYKLWCKRCHAEYMIEVEKCGRCQGPLMRQEERRAQLLAKVDDYKLEKAEHMRRKDKWIRWKKSQALIGKSGNINYKAWEYWEPETDDEEEPEPVVPKDDPQFKAMELDIKQRHKKIDDQRLTAARYKESGNKKMMEGDYTGAIQDYEEGLEYRKDTKCLWTNKALAELKIYRYEAAIESTSKVLQLSEIFDDGYEKDRDINIKAFLRRAQGYRGLHKWAQAAEDLKEAVTLGSKEAKDLLVRTQEAEKEHKRACALKNIPSTPTSTVSEKKIEEVHDNDDDDGEDAPTNEAATAATSTPSQPRKVVIEQDEEDTLEEYSKEQFRSLMQSLGGSEEERLLFCTRAGSDKSRLDEVLKETERTCMLWRKATGKTNQQKIDECYKSQMKNENTGGNNDKSKDEKNTVSRLEDTALRCIKVLRILMRNSSLAGELCLTAVRHLFQFMHSDRLCADLLSILADLSYQDSTREHIISVLSRTEEHITRLVSLATVDCKENFMPPQASEEDTELVIRPPPVESSLIILGNVAKSLKIRKMLVPHSQALLKMVGRRTLPNDFIFCEKVCALLINTAGSDEAGQTFCDIMKDECLPQVINAIKKDSAHMPGHEERLSRLLAALVNAMSVSSALRQRFNDLKTIDAFIDVVENEKEHNIRARALTIINKALNTNLDAVECEPRLMKIIKKSLDCIKEPIQIVDDAVVRLATVLICQGPTLKRWKAGSDGLEEGQEVLRKLIALIHKLKPTQYLSETKAEGDCSLRSTMIGNCALMCSTLAPEEAFNLAPTIPVFIEGLRKETGTVQNNCGVCVTKLAMVERYKPLVRSLKGFESLHQIQLKNQTQLKTSVERQRKEKLCLAN